MQIFKKLDISIKMFLGLGGFVLFVYFQSVLTVNAFKWFFGPDRTSSSIYSQKVEAMRVYFELPGESTQQEEREFEDMVQKKLYEENEVFIHYTRLEIENEKLELFSLQFLWLAPFFFYYFLSMWISWLFTKESIGH
jgi:hypothetical protein